MILVNLNPNPAITIASIDCVCHCEHPKGAWQSLQKRRDCGACSEYSEESRSSLLRLRLATSLAMTILIAGFRNEIASASPRNDTFHDNFRIFIWLVNPCGAKI